MYRSLSRPQAMLLALVVLGGLALGTVGLFAVGSRHWLGDTFHVRAGFADIGGVEVGTRVHIQGLDAGDVEAVEMPKAPGDSVVLRLRLAGRFRALVGAGAVVEIANESLLGGKVVRIVPGPQQTAPLAEDALLASRPATELTEGLAQAATRLNRVLAEADAALTEFRRGEGPAGKLGKDLSQAVTRLDGVLTQVQSAVDDVQRGKGSLGKLIREDTLYNDLSATVAEIKAAVKDIRKGEGTLGMLARNNDAYTETVKSLQEVRQMVSSVKQNADAIKSLPVVRSYVVDVNKELIRPDCKRERKWFRTGDLFEPDRAILTARGRHFLDEGAAWLNERKQEGSEVVVASFADPKENPEFAQQLTRKQSEVVVDYLRSNHKVQRMGFWWWSNRGVRALGCGVTTPPVPETEQLPAARVELLVFVPQN